MPCLEISQKLHKSPEIRRLNIRRQTPKKRETLCLSSNDVFILKGKELSVEPVSDCVSACRCWMMLKKYTNSYFL